MRTDTTTDWLAAFLQSNDPLFPTGAYAHSFGLEEIVQSGMVHDEASLLLFVRHHLIPIQENLELPLVRHAFEAALAGDIETLCQLNAEVDALRLSRESREASLSLGTRRLQTASKIFPRPFLLELSARVPAPHHPIAYGVQMAVSGAPLHAALTGAFYQALAGTCSASLKLIRIGQEGVQRVLTDGLRDAERVINVSLDIPRDKIGVFNPMMEIAAMRHEQAKERLFIS